MSSQKRIIVIDELVSEQVKETKKPKVGQVAMTTKKKQFPFFSLPLTIQRGVVGFADFATVGSTMAAFSRSPPKLQELAKCLESPFPFSVLSNDLQARVVQFLDIPSLGALACTSKRLKKVAKLDAVWESHLRHLLKDVFEFQEPISLQTTDFLNMMEVHHESRDFFLSTALYACRDGHLREIYLPWHQTDHSFQRYYGLAATFFVLLSFEFAIGRLRQAQDAAALSRCVIKYKKRICRRAGKLFDICITRWNVNKILDSGAVEYLFIQKYFLEHRDIPNEEDLWSEFQRLRPADGEE